MLVVSRPLFLETLGILFTGSAGVGLTRVDSTGHTPALNQPGPFLAACKDAAHELPGVQLPSNSASHAVSCSSRRVADHSLQ